MITAEQSDVSKFLREELDATRSGGWFDNNIALIHPTMEKASETSGQKRRGSTEQTIPGGRSITESTSKESAEALQKIEYLAWRHLEHILSVCAIPLSTLDSKETPLVALTCGDMSGHRICTSASL